MHMREQHQSHKLKQRVIFCKSMAGDVRTDAAVTTIGVEQ